MPVTLADGQTVTARVTTLYVADGELAGIPTRTLEETMTLPLDLDLSDGLGLGVPVSINGHYQGTAEYVLDAAPVASRSTSSMVAPRLAAKDWWNSSTPAQVVAAPHAIPASVQPSSPRRPRRARASRMARSA